MAKKINKIDIITWVLLAVVLLSNIFTLYMSITSSNDIPVKVKQAVELNPQKVDYSKVDGIVSAQVDSKIESTNMQAMVDAAVEKKVNSLNLKDGAKGEKGDKGDTVVSQPTIVERVIESVTIDGPKGDKGDNGLTPIIRCNEVSNRWEYRYDELERWRLLNNEVIKCTIKE